MTYELKICKSGEPAPYKTTVDISEKDGKVRFFFTAEHTGYYCPYSRYNGIHSDGDACEILIGSDPERKVYYEMEVSAEGELMLAEMINHGPDENGVPILDTHLIPNCFFEGRAVRTENGYTAEFVFDKKQVMTHGERVYFNAYRLDTDGGEEVKRHLFALSPTMKPRFHLTEYFLWLDEHVN